MFIELACPACGAQFKMNPEVAGPKFVCGNCGNSVSIPSEAISAKPAQPSPAMNSLPLPSAVEVIPWETFRVATRIASWSAILGLVGSLSYGLGSFLLQSWAANLAASQPAILSFQFYFECLLIGIIGMGLSFAFAMVAAGVCRASRVAGDSIEWGSTSLFSMSLSIAAVLAIPFLFNVLDGDADVARLVLKGIILLMVCGALAGHACLATGFGRTATRLGHSGLQFSIALYCCLLVSLGVWTMLNVFVFTGADTFVADPFYNSGMGSGAAFQWINLFTSTLATAAHYYWFGKIARQTEVAVRKHQITFA